MIAKEEKKKIIHFRPVFYLFLSLMIGIIFARKIYSGDLFYIILSISLFVILFFVCFYRKKFLALILCFVTFLVGNGVFYLAANPYYNLPMYETNVVVEGRVTDSIDDSGYAKTVVLENVSINGQKTKNIYLSITNSVGTIEAGQRLTFLGRVERQKLFELGSFSSYCVRQNIGYKARVNYSDIVFAPGEKQLDEKIRESLRQTLFQNMDEDNASLAYAVLTGDKSYIDEYTYSFYKSTGIVHLLTVSGLHVGILIAFLAYVFKLLKLKGWINFLITALLLLCYNFICGFTPSVMRASIMGLCLLLSIILGKQRDGLVSLGVAGFVITLINPLYVFDSGFLMSFFCLALIIILYRPIFRVLNKILPKWASSYISLSLCSQIAILPYLASFFQKINFLAFFVNLIVVPLFSFVFILLLVLTIISTLLKFLGPTLYLSNFTFTFLTSIAKFYTDPIAMINLYPIDESITVTMSLIIFTVSDFLMLKWKAKAIILSVLGGIFIIAISVASVPFKNSDSQIFYISSYGNMICLRSKNGQSLIVGESLNKERFLRYEKIKNVDFLLMTSEPSISGENAGYGEKSVLSYEDYASVDGERILDKNQINLIGDFAIRSIYSYGKVLATKIDFDGISIFFTNVGDLSYNETMIEPLLDESVDVAFVYHNIWLCSKVDAKVKVTEMHSSIANYSWEEQGNMQFNKNLVLRSVD